MVLAGASGAAQAAGPAAADSTHQPAVVSASPVRAGHPLGSALVHAPRVRCGCLGNPGYHAEYLPTADDVSPERVAGCEAARAETHPARPDQRDRRPEQLPFRPRHPEPVAMGPHVSARDMAGEQVPALVARLGEGAAAQPMRLTPADCHAQIQHGGVLRPEAPRSIGWSPHSRGPDPPASRSWARDDHARGVRLAVAYVELNSPRGRQASFAQIGRLARQQALLRVRFGVAADWLCARPRWPTAAL